MRRQVFAFVYLGLGVAGLAAMLLWFQYAHRTWITTANAEVWAPTYSAAAPQGGRVTAWTTVLPGSRVHRGQVLGQIATAAGPVIVRAQHAGRLVGDFGYRGELVAAGQTLATVADLSRSYVLAYVNETRAASLAVGDPADLYLASNPGHRVHGTVERVYPAVAAATWPLPALQTGAFSQQTQWVPVRLRIDGSGTFYLGGSVTVGISIGGGAGE